MRDPLRDRQRVLAIYPFSRGFAFAVLEAPLTWVDSGTKRVVGRNGAAVWAAVEKLMSQHDAHLLAVERDVSATRSRESLRVLAEVLLAARRAGLSAVRVPDTTVRVTMGLKEKATLYDVAALLSEAFPQLRSQQLNRRQPWEAESERGKVFRAVGIGVGGLALRAQAKRQG